MILKILIPSIVTVTVGLIGLFIVHHFTQLRDQKNKVREVRLNYLLEAYRRLESCAERPIVEDGLSDRFESAIADIQFLGSQEQTDMAKQLSIAIATFEGDPSVMPLLVSLRDELRQELGLGKLEQKPISLRFKSAGQPTRAPDRANRGG